MATENSNEWDRFCRLGEMIGDGLHYEEPWILREYKKLQQILLPDATKREKEYKRKIRKLKNEKINSIILEKLKTQFCDCGNKLQQVRGGSKVVKCTNADCNKRYRYNFKN